MLSYLCGLAPVGETVETKVATILADLGLKHRKSFYEHLARLVAAGCVRRISVGCRQTSGVLVVLRRPEEVAWDYSHLWRQPQLIG